jgi:hypothetical protein
MTFAIDGFTGATGTSVNTTSISAALTTSNSCVIWAAVQNEGGSHQSISPSTITDNSGLGLTWVQQASEKDGFNNGLTELWSAVSPQALAGVTITATFASQTENAAIIVWGTDGVNTASIVDPNASLPVQVKATSSPLTASISTTNAPDLGILVAGAGNASIAGLTGGWTLLDTAQITSGHTFSSELQVYYQSFPGQQSGLSSALSTSGASRSAALLIIALNAAPAPSVTRAQSVLVGF